jgi:hypothetical protein
VSGLEVLTLVVNKDEGSAAEVRADPEVRRVYLGERR